MNLRIRTSHHRPRVAFVLLDEDNFPIESPDLDDADAPQPLTIAEPTHVRAVCTNGELK